MTGDVFDWLPHELAYVALRLARADELQEHLGRACLNWSMNALELKQIRRPDGLLDVVVDHVRPIPPIVELLFSEIVNHLRSAIDNVVYYMVENSRGRPLPDGTANLVTMPIVPSAEALKKWSERRCGRVPELSDGTELYRRIESQQPYRSLAVVTAISAKFEQFERFTGPIELHGEHPLTLLQRYSNTDKHRAVRVAVGRTLEGQNQPVARRVEPGMNFRPLKPGDLLAEGLDPRPQAVDLQTAVFVQRPAADVWVSPPKELGQIHGYVSEVLIPSLLTGGPTSPALPRQIWPYVTNVSISPDGKRTYALVGGTAWAYDPPVSISVIDSDPTSSTYNTQIATIALPGAYDVTFSPDSSRVASWSGMFFGFRCGLQPAKTLSSPTIT